MKQFNLQEAISGKPIFDQFGRQVKFIAYVPEALEHERVVYLGNLGYVMSVGENGCPFSCGQYWHPALYMSDGKGD